MSRVGNKLIKLNENVTVDGETTTINDNIEVGNDIFVGYERYIRFSRRRIRGLRSPHHRQYAPQRRCERKDRINL